MAKIIRGPSGPAIRDGKGQYTAISFVTESGKEVWISNSLVRAVCGLITVLAAMLFGALQPSLATPVTDLLKSVLRGTLT